MVIALLNPTLSCLFSLFRNIPDYLPLTTTCTSAWRHKPDKILEIDACIESPTYSEQELGFFYSVQVPIFYQTNDKNYSETGLIEIVGGVL